MMSKKEIKKKGFKTCKYYMEGLEVFVNCINDNSDVTHCSSACKLHKHK